MLDVLLHKMLLKAGLAFFGGGGRDSPKKCLLGGPGKKNSNTVVVFKIKCSRCAKNRPGSSPYGIRPGPVVSMGFPQASSNPADAAMI